MVLAASVVKGQTPKYPLEESFSTDRVSLHSSKGEAKHNYFIWYQYDLDVLM